jgi:signal recognition particle subunit SRP54
MINSMTVEERKNPDLLASSPSRRKRIAKGSGMQEKDVMKLVSDFQKMRVMMQQMSQGMLPGMGMPGMGMPGMGMPGMGGMRGGYPGMPKAKKKKEKKKKGFGQL